MDFRDLEYFRTIACCGSLTQAAGQLFITQPALSKLVRRAEEEAGVALFRYQGRQMQLTEAGQCYLRHAEKLLEAREDMNRELSAFRRADSGVLRVAMPSFRCSFTLPAVLPLFSELYPRVELRVTEASTAKIHQLLADGEADIGLFHAFRPESGLQYEVLAPDRVWAAVSPENPLTKQASVSLAELCRGTLILQSREQALGQYIRGELKEKKLQPQRQVDSSNIRAALSLAASGYGVAFASGLLLAHFPGKPLVKLALTDCSRDYPSCAVWRKNVSLPACAGDFIALCRRITQAEFDNQAES